MRWGSTGRFWITGVLFAFVLLVRCGPDDREAPAPDGGGSSVAPRGDAGDGSGPDATVPQPPPEPRFQTTFSLALRESETHDQVVTYREELPSVLGGDAVRVTFRAGAGGMSLLGATIATPTSGPIPLPLPPAAQDVAPDARVTSEPLALEVIAGEPLVITFAIVGSVAAGRIDNLPGSEQRSGNHVTVEGPLNGTARRRPAGVVAIEVRALPSPVLVALGDSITEGYVSGADDVRRAWPQQAAEALGVPFLNAAVSAQGVKLAAEYLDEEVLSLTGITDCVMLLGTNDLHAFTAEALIAELTALIERMQGHCRVWAATLLPKERTSVGDLSEVIARRKEVNAWLRDEAPVEGVLDLEAAVRGESADTFEEGLDEDGIHPSVLGQERLGEAAADFFRELAAPVPEP